MGSESDLPVMEKRGGFEGDGVPHEMDISSPSIA